MGDTRFEAPQTSYVSWALGDDGSLRIRKWSQFPFDGATDYTALPMAGTSGFTDAAPSDQLMPLFAVGQIFRRKFKVYPLSVFRQLHRQFLRCGDRQRNLELVRRIVCTYVDLVLALRADVAYAQHNLPTGRCDTPFDQTTSRDIPVIIHIPLAGIYIGHCNTPVQGMSCSRNSLHMTNVPSISIGGLELVPADHLQLALQIAHQHNEFVIAELDAIRKSVRNAMGAIESNQVADKDVHGTLDGVLKRLGALVNAKERTQ